MLLRWRWFNNVRFFSRLLLISTIPNINWKFLKIDEKYGLLLFIFSALRKITHAGTGRGSNSWLSRLVSVTQAEKLSSALTQRSVYEKFKTKMSKIISTKKFSWANFEFDCSLQLFDWWFFKQVPRWNIFVFWDIYWDRYSQSVIV